MGHILLKDLSKKSADMGVGTVLRFEVKVTVLRSRQNRNVLWSKFYRFFVELAPILLGDILRCVS